MSAHNWSRFVVRINTNTPHETLYKAWATRPGLEKWFLRMAEFKGPDGSTKKNNDPVQKGDTYRWMWFGWPDSVVEEGEVLEANGKDFFSFRFGKAGIVDVQLKKEEGESIVELVQHDIPTDEKAITNWHIGCKTGWTFYLANLKSIYEGGLDLRNKNEKIQEVISS